MASRQNIREEKENVNERMKNTRKDIETLKSDLQKLIQTGSQTTKPLQLASASQKNNCVPLGTRKRQRDKSPIVRPHTAGFIPKTFKPVSPSQSQTAKPNTSLDKKRHYNVQETRDYIRKQREKRAEQLKLQINLADNNIDIKKHKLRELQETCKELVTRNVQYSRQRSKSRDPTPNVRPDRSRSRPNINEIDSRQDRSRSRPKNEPVALECQFKRKSPRQAEKKLNSQERGRVRNRDNVDGPSQVSKDQTLLTSAVSAKLSKKVLVTHPKETNTEKSIDRPQSENIDYLQAPIVDLKSTNIFDKTVCSENILSDQPIKKKEKRSTDDPQPKNVDYLQVPVVEPRSNNNFDKTVFPPPKSKKKGKKHKIADACAKDSKETQTSRENQYGLLQSGDAVPYPYNFINTVKWKLQQAVTTTPNETKTALVQHELTPQTQQTNHESLKDLREKLIKSASSMRLGSCQKPPNLDFDVVGNLGLVNHISHKPEELMSQRLFENYDSESDTSKNIPEISSESISEKNVNPELNLGKVKKLKLTKNNSSVQTEDLTYSSDFMQESSVKAAELSPQNNISKDFGTSINTNKDSSNKLSTIFTPLLLKDQSNNSRENFKSLFTDSQISKTPTFYPTNISGDTSQFEMGLKPPSLSLNFANGRVSENAIKNNTVRSPTSEMFLNTHNNDQLKRSFTSKSLANSLRESTCGSQINDVDLELLLNSDENKALDSFKSVSTEASRSNCETNNDESLKEPANSLKGTFPNQQLGLGNNILKNITIRPVTSTLNNNTVNEIHLKFEAEVRLLNDFNESFKQFVAVEKAFEDLKDKDRPTTKILQSVDTQTSVVAKTSNITERSSRNSISTINFSRGSELSEEEINTSVQNINHNNRSSLMNSLQNSSFEWNLPNINDSVTMLSVAEEDRSKVSMSNVENCNSKGCAGVLSLNIFDQLIKDEDARIEHLRTIIKIREQALLDRTKGELVWLEIQRKQLIETGKIERASLIKKKQRGIILKHEQERNEIKKLKQMQKEESEKRKNSLKQQRNIIKSRLSTENMLTGIKAKKTKERRSSGPLRVVQSCSESIHSEMSFSIRSSTIDEVSSLTSRSVRLSEIESEVETSDTKMDTERSKQLPFSNAKRTLFIRETALQKRRKTAEELLQWHRKLLEEEKKIVELEKAATTVIGGSTKNLRKYIGKQLNQLWTKMTGSKENKYVDDKVYVMSQLALEQLCKNARHYSHKIKKSKSSDFINEISIISDSEASNRSAKIITNETNYSSVFESDSVAEEQTKISSIAELIDNFSRIEDEISIISRRSVQDIDELNTKCDSSVVKTGTSLDSIKLNSSGAADLETPVKPVEEAKISSSLKKVVATNFVVISPKLVEEGSQSQISEEIAKSQLTLTDAPTQSHSTFVHSSSAKFCIINENLEDVMTPNVTESNEVEESETANKESNFTNEVQTSSAEVVEAKSSEDAKISEINEEFSFNHDAQTGSEEILKDKNDVVFDQEDSVIILSSDSEKSATEATASYSPQLIVEQMKEESFVGVSTERSSELSSRFNDPLETPKSTLIPIEQSEQSQLITNLSLDEALQSASQIEQSLSNINEKLSSNSNSEAKTIEDENLSIVSEDLSQSSSSVEDEKTPQKKIDVKKRVSEILADASPRNDRSPRVQDLYVTTYDVGSNAEPGDSDDGRQIASIFNNEAEELRRKELAIEQEIKQLELQQKELPFRYMREIPNKPPPPYTPPSPQAPALPTIVPSDVRELNEIACYSSKVLFKACETKALDKVKFSENGFKLISKIEVPKSRAEFLFNVCKDITRNYYKQFQDTEHKPSWLILPKQPTKSKPKEAFMLERILNRKLKETFGFAKAQVTESAIIKWGRKKRDHVDEVLVVESLEEESQWTNFDLDQLIVKDRLATQILNMVLKKECDFFIKTFERKFRIE